MGWLVGYTIASMVGALFVVRIFDYITSGVVGGVVNTAKAGLFVGTWTAITAGSGMRDFGKRIRHLRQVNRDVSSRIDAPRKTKRK